MEEFDLGHDDLTEDEKFAAEFSEKFMEHSDDFAPLREFIVGQKNTLQAMGFSEESSDKMAAKLWEFYLEGMIAEMRKQDS